MATIRDDDRTVVATRTAPDDRVLTDRFGGLDLPASLVGLLVAISLELMLAAGIAAIVGTNFDLANISEDVAVGTLVAAVAVMFVAYFVGGWAAGRVARYDGVLNGAMVALFGILLAALFAGLGAWAGDEYDLFAQVGAPSWVFDALDGLGTEALIAGGAALAAMLIGGTLGGKLGENYHRDADETLAAASHATAVPPAEPLEERRTVDGDRRHATRRHDD